jgi:hypothetical protein
MRGRLKLRSDALEWREMDGEIVALDLRSSTYFAVNPSAAVVWPALADGATREQLVEQLAERYSVDPGDAARDVDAFLASLESQGLLEAS